jgi:Tol biopolymer transport system component
VERVEEKRSARRLPAWLAALAAVLVTAIGITAWEEHRHRDIKLDAPVRKFDLALEDLTLESAPVISPGGRHIAYIGQRSITDPPHLRVYNLSLGAAETISGTEGASAPFWSPDGQFIAFAAGRELRKNSVAGGTTGVLCQLPPATFRGGTWHPDGTKIVFAAGSRGRLYEVPSRGGDPKPILDAADDKTVFSAPNFLPRAAGPLILYASRTNVRGHIMVRNVSTGRAKALELGFYPVYSSGHIVYQTLGANSGIWALPFSLESLASTGEAFPIARIARFPSAASDGTLVYLTRGLAEQYRLAWVDREGRKMGEIGQPQQKMILPILSPDESVIGVEGWELTTGADLWIHDASGPSKTRLTWTYPAEESRTIWSPDGKEVAFWSDRNGTADVFIQAADGSGEARPVLATRLEEWPEDWSADGNYIIVTVEETGVNRSDIWYLKKAPDGSFNPVPFLAQPDIYRDAAKLSPDGRFLAYVSDETGRAEVWVSPFPQGGQKWQVSTSGATQPRWSRNGKELFYVQRDTLFAVPVSTKAEFSMGEAKRLFTHSTLYWRFPHAQYDVSADGKRFVVTEPVGPVQPLAIRVVENWLAEFRDRKN